MKRILVYLAALGFGILACWRLWEQDIFWQVRAGLEILSSGHLQRVDSWSYTMPGEVWNNVQWLSTVLIALIYQIGSTEGLIIARGICVAGLFGILTHIFKNRGASAGVTLGLLSAAFVAMSFRLQIRSEIFCLLIEAALIWIWTRPGQKNVEAWTLALLILASQLHVGVLPFLILTAIFLKLGTSGIWNAKSWMWVVAFASAVVINPYPVASIDFIWTHLFYGDHNQLTNPEHEPLVWPWLTRIEEGLSGWAWVSLMIVAAIGLLRSSKSERPLPYQSRAWTLAVGFIFIALCFNRTRAIPYAVLLLAPMMPLAFQRFGKWGWGVALAGVALLISHLPLTSLQWGFGLQKGIWPEGSFRFVEQTKPKKNLYTSFTFGHYQLMAAPDYPVFGDTRETLFRDLQEPYKKAYSSPRALNHLLEKYDANTIVIKIPGTEPTQFGTWRDILEEYTPSGYWALVYFDDVSVVLLRRVPENREIIEKYEYKTLRPNLPFDNYLKTSPRPVELDRRHVEELNRCRSEEPTNVYCALAAAVYTAMPGTDAAIRAAVEILQPIKKEHPENPDVRLFIENAEKELATSSH